MSYEDEVPKPNPHDGKGDMRQLIGIGILFLCLALGVGSCSLMSDIGTYYLDKAHHEIN